MSLWRSSRQRFPCVQEEDSLFGSRGAQCDGEYDVSDRKLVFERSARINNLIFYHQHTQVPNSDLFMGSFVHRKDVVSDVSQDTTDFGARQGERGRAVLQNSVECVLELDPEQLRT